jgi:hypothetical protein
MSKTGYIEIALRLVTVACSCLFSANSWTSFCNINLDRCYPVLVLFEFTQKLLTSTFSLLGPIFGLKFGLSSAHFFEVNSRNRQKMNVKEFGSCQGTS